MKDFKVVSFDIHNSLFDILRFNIVLAETMIKAGMTVAHKRGVVFLFILKITAMFWSDNVTGEIIL
jgi:hypothetical protein